MIKYVWGNTCTGFFVVGLLKASNKLMCLIIQDGEHGKAWLPSLLRSTHGKNQLFLSFYFGAPSTICTTYRGETPLNSQRAQESKDLGPNMTSLLPVVSNGDLVSVYLVLCKPDSTGSPLLAR